MVREGERQIGYGTGFNLWDKKPVREGDEYTVTIKDISDRGDGVARIRNFVVFVPNSKQGDKVKIRIRNVKWKHAIGDIIEKKEKEKSVAETAEEAVVESQSAEEEREPKKALLKKEDIPEELREKSVEGEVEDPEGSAAA